AFATSLCASVVLALATALASAGEIKVVTVGALQNALKAIAADFTKETGGQVTYTFTSPAALKGLLADGKFDAIIAAAPALEELTSSLQTGLRVKVARVGIG